MNSIGKISEAELSVMKILWEADGESGIGTNEIVKELQGQMEWDRSTIRTLLKRLVEKGAVIQKKEIPLLGKKEVMRHWPAVSEEAYRKEQTKGLIDKLYDGNAKNLVAALVDNKALSQEDFSELAAFFEER